MRKLLVVALLLLATSQAKADYSVQTYWVPVYLQTNCYNPNPVILYYIAVPVSSCYGSGGNNHHHYYQQQQQQQQRPVATTNGYRPVQQRH